MNRLSADGRPVGQNWAGVDRTAFAYPSGGVTVFNIPAGPSFEVGDYVLNLKCAVARFERLFKGRA